ncbi:MAG: M48 family metalloprotease [Gammaproteobacteria bacterium]
MKGASVLKKLKHTVVGAALSLVFLSPAYLPPALADQGLPQLGENAVFNIEWERKLGEKFYRRLLAQGVVETDLLLDQYINELGARLLSGLDRRVRDYRFFIVKDMGVNAFAVPGGFIGVNIGLINQAKSSHQLASVLAHEIAHVRLMHSLRLMEKASSVSSTALLSLLAGILLGGANAEVGAAMVYGSVAGSQQSVINFTRENEYEADRLGIDLLQDAEFDANGMVEFFKIMERLAGNTGIQSIEYLRTHPVHVNRISEAEARIRSGTLPRQDDIYYLMFREYLRYVNSDNLAVTGGQFRKALALTKLGQYQPANQILLKLHQQDGENIWYGYTLAENLEFLNRPEDAEKIYRQMLEIYPGDYVLSLRLARFLRTSEQYTAALEIARPLEINHPRKQAVFYELTEIYQRLGQTIFAMMSEAEYHRLAGNRERAIQLYDEILSSAETDLATESRAREKRTQIE